MDSGSMNSIGRTGVIATTVLGAISVAAAQTAPYQSSHRGRIGSGLGQTELPAGGLFEPRVEAAAQFVSNLNLAEEGESQIDTAGIEVAPGFYASYATRTAIGAIDYSIIGRYWEEDDINDVSHRLSANGQWFAVPEWFSIRGEASYQDGVIDPRVGLNYGGIGVFAPGNLQEVGAASVTPVFRRRVQDFEMVAEYSYGRTWFLDQGRGQPVVGFVGDEDSTDQSANLALGTAVPDSQVSARVFYDWQRSEFETALPFEYERVGIDAGYQLSRSLALIGDAGRESDLDSSTTQGGLDSDFWSTGLRWQPSDRTRVEARYGERFFGNSYLFSASHHARIVEFSASYREEPTVQTRNVSLGAFEPGQLPPSAPDTDFGTFTSSPYVAKDALAEVAVVGSRTRVSLSGFRYEMDYLSGIAASEVASGVGLEATRQLASNLSATFEISYRDNAVLDAPLDPDPSGTTAYYDTELLVRLDRSSGAHFTLGGEAGYLTRSGTSDFDGWWVALRTTWTP